MDFFDNVLDLRQYADALDQERTKIQVFQRELPLCFELVSRAIDSCRQQLSGLSTESSERTSSDEPVFEEFIPIKKSSANIDVSHSEIDDDDVEQSKSEKVELGPLDWLKSAQLWNQTPDPPVLEDGSKKLTSMVIEVKNNGGGGAFRPFQKEKTPVKTEGAPAGGKAVGGSPVAEATTSSTAETGGNSKREGKEYRAQRKQRRSWSSELHRRFVHALQQLGGAHVATPKQIRELMKIDGLTNDEVKSHLQKYRLYAKRPTNSSMPSNGSSSPSQQFMVVGSLWAPPPGRMRNGIYAPVATALRRQATTEEGKGSHGGGVVQSNSPASTS